MNFILSERVYEIFYFPIIVNTMQNCKYLFKKKCFVFKIRYLIKERLRLQARIYIIYQLLKF